MRYSELLVKLYDVVLKLKKQNKEMLDILMTDYDKDKDLR